MMPPRTESYKCSNCGGSGISKILVKVGEYYVCPECKGKGYLIVKFEYPEIENVSFKSKLKDMFPAIFVVCIMILIFLVVRYC